MAGQRDRIINLINYIEKCDIAVNVGKNKARGNKGVFITRNNHFRIDIAKKQDENTILSTLLHEFAHFLHYKHDKTLSSLNFIFKENNDEIMEELIKVSVQYVPKEDASKIYSQKSDLTSKINVHAKNLKNIFPEFKISKPFKPIEHSIRKPASYFLKYDRVKIYDKVYDLQDISELVDNDTQLEYIKLKSLQRKLRRINSRIQKINSYYNKPTELISRFIEMYYTDYNKALSIAPHCTQELDNIIYNNTIPELKEIKNIL